MNTNDLKEITKKIKADLDCGLAIDDGNSTSGLESYCQGLGSDPVLEAEELRAHLKGEGIDTVYRDGDMIFLGYTGKKYQAVEENGVLLHVEAIGMSDYEKFQAIMEAKEEIAEAWSGAAVGWNTWVSVDGDGKVYTSTQTTSTSPHPDNDEYVMSLPFIYEVSDECDDGTGHCNPEDLFEDIEKEARRALGL